MNTGIQIFKNSQFGEVRLTEIDGKTYFAGNDIAKALGYQVPKDAISAHCKGAVKCRLLTNGGMQEMNVIPEGDIYRLVANSQLPGAEKFEAWVFDEVLPSIRKHGGYLTPQKLEEALLNPDTLIQLATNLKEERQKRIEAESVTKELQITNDAMKPKTLFADAVATSNRSVLVSELAKILKQNGITTGQNRLFIYLRVHGYLCSKGEYYNQPTQKGMELGLFEIKKQIIGKPDGSVLVKCTTKVTGKGQIYFVNKFLQHSPEPLKNEI
ncbi:MAG: phage antirepressor KilAC domain-containing protein [Proteiniphilum sp.]|jgi:anti-repressor protein|nr:phage antirepressor KilAC domain-containing protein [Proteiniphilum sp.]